MRSVASRSTLSTPPSGDADENDDDDEEDDDEAAVGEVEAEAEVASSDERRSGLERWPSCFAPPPWTQQTHMVHMLCSVHRFRTQSILELHSLNRRY